MGDTSPLYPPGFVLVQHHFQSIYTWFVLDCCFDFLVFLNLSLDGVDLRAWGNRKSVFYGDDVQHDSKKKKKTKKKKTSMLIITSKRNF